MSEPITRDNAANRGAFSEYRKTATTRISDFTVEPGVPYQTPEGLRAEDEETRIAFDVQGGVYPIRESVFRASYAPAEREAATPPLDVRPEVASFASLMERVLRDNDHKGGWKDCRPSWLLARLRQEVDELDEAMRKGTIARRDESGRTSEWPADIAHEAADVANFAMMIADVLAARLAQQDGTEE